MAEPRIAFLYKAASMLPSANINPTLEKLKSYYRMRCKEISKGYGLPQKHFSSQVMCTHCCLEWGKGTEMKVRSIKLSKRQRKRIKTHSKKGNQANRLHLLASNEIEQICAFCGHSAKTVTLKLKPNKPNTINPPQPEKELKAAPKKVNENVNNVKNKQLCDVYSNSTQVFSLNNKKNTLKSKIKEPKIINNNKKKKDKFAGLCQKAVLMSAHLKQEKLKQDKLNLFLKPCF